MEGVFVFGPVNGGLRSYLVLSRRLDRVSPNLTSRFFLCGSGKEVNGRVSSIFGYQKWSGGQAT